MKTLRGSHIISGYYMYVEASSTRANTKGGFTKTYTGLDSKGSCLTFWYHMFGAHTGFLKVYVNTPANGTKTPQFAVDGQQGDLWIKGEITISTISAVVSLLHCERVNNILKRENVEARMLKS